MEEEPLLFSNAEMGKLVRKGFKVIEDYNEHCWNEDILYMQKKLFAALQIPKRYLQDKAQ